MMISAEAEVAVVGVGPGCDDDFKQCIQVEDMWTFDAMYCFAGQKPMSMSSVRTLQRRENQRKMMNSEEISELISPEAAASWAR